MVTHLEPDILVSKFKWAFRSFTRNKTCGDDGIWVVLLKILKDDILSVALNTSANLETSAVATGLEKVSFHSNPKEGQCQRTFQLLYSWNSLVAQLAKNPPAMQDILVQSLCQGVPLEKDRLPTPVFLGFPDGSDGKESPAMWKTWFQSLGWEDSLEGQAWQHTPEKPHGQRSLVGYSPWGHKESDTTKQLSTIQLHSFNMLARSCSKSFRLGFRSMWNKNFRCRSWV